MPTYDYRCRDCGHEFEIQQSFSDDALTECPACQGDLRKVFSAVGISFKGSGFYKTDSRSSSSSASAGTSKESSSTESSSTEKSTSSSTSTSSSGSSGAGSKKDSSSTTSAA
jgi:putative FmdB family regulatory protein